MHILHCSQLGNSMFQDFIRQLQVAGREGKAGRTALVLPSPYLLEQARTQLRLTECPAWEFPKVLSLDELAAQLAGLPKISRVEQELLIDGIVKETATDGLFPYFDKIVDFPGFVSALARLFDEFKMASVTPDELETAVEALTDEVERNADRDAAITGLFRAYQERLMEYSLMDVGGMYCLAVDTLAQAEQPLPFDQIFMAEFSVLSPLRLQLIERLKRRVSMEIGICFEKNRPGVFRSVEPVYQALVGMGFTPEFHSETAKISPALSQLRRNLFCERVEPMERADGIQLQLCPNRSKELSVTADGVKKLLVQEQYSPREIALVLQDPGDYSQLRALFDERGIPVDTPERLPLLERALPRLLFDWIRLLQERGSRSAAFAVMKSPYVRDKLEWDCDEMEKCLLEEVLKDWEDWPAAMQRRAPAENVSESWRQGWQELRQRGQEWAGDSTWANWAERLQDFLSWIDAPAAICRRRIDGVLSLEEARAEMQCLQALQEAVTELEQVAEKLRQPEEKAGAGKFAEMIRRFLADATVTLVDRQATGVQVVTPETASGANFRAVFVLGLAEGKFPAPPRESWLYSDRERRTLGEAGVLLPTSEERTAAADFAFALAAGMATEKVTFSAITDSETLPSRFLTEVERLFVSKVIARTTFGPHQVVAETADEVCSPQELLRATLHHRWRQADHAAGWEDLYAAMGALLPDGLERRAKIELERQGAYAGQIDPGLISGLRFSPSALEQYAACPFAYFVTEVMKLEEGEAAEEGFDALSSGSVWHEVLAAFLARHRGQKLDSASVEVYARELIQLLEVAVTRREGAGQVRQDVWWQYEKPRWEKALHDWLMGELARQNGTAAVPCFFEWAFGATVRRGSDPASTELPLRIETGGENEPAEIQGKVDRIDFDGKRYRIIDYKTGKAPSRKQVEQGLRLQVPLYMLAVEALLCAGEETVDEGMYLPVGTTAAEMKIPGGKMSREELLNAARQFAGQYVSGIRSGQFPAHPAGACSSWCAARTFCRRETETNGEGMEETGDE